MKIVNEGTLYANRMFSAQAEKLIRSMLEKYHPWLDTQAMKAENGEQEVGTIEITDEYGSYLDMDLNRLIDALKPLGIQLEGRIKYYGDCEGYYVVKPGEAVFSITPDEAAILDASDAALITELQRRGFQVSQAEKLIVATSFGKLGAAAGEELDRFPEIILFLERDDGKKQRIAVVGDLSRDDPAEDSIRVGVYGNPSCVELSDAIHIPRSSIFSPHALWEEWKD